MKKKWIISEITPYSRFRSAGRLILRNKLKAVRKLSKKYKNDESIENLHDLRIAVRRFRYTLENFIILFDEDVFAHVLSLSKDFQDKLGEIRDLDVLSQKVKSISKKSKSPIPRPFYNFINKNNKELRSKIVHEIDEYLSDKYIKKILKNDYRRKHINQNK